MHAISVSNLTFGYNPSVPILQQCSFDIVQGDFVAVAGPNGAGKSTLIKNMIGILTPDSGTITVADSLKNKIGYMPQKAYFSIPSFPATVREVVSTGVVLKKKFPRRLTKTDRVMVDTAMSLLQIEDLASKRVGELSGGQQQRVLLARAFASDPEILILDEPTGALDPHTRGCFYETLRSLNQKRGTTILMVTHDTHSLDKFAGKLLFIDRSVVYYGPIEGFEDQEPQHSQHYFRHSHEKKTVVEDSCQ